ncbi:SxtJ family membrane protein [Oleiphilus sp. HI0117]|uniref:SxtJ family membrane protein n=3 Tax=unclassified Oleiphilus TaxID=2631174 RepID=UPI0007C299BA|nr:SxtJ family membrane protein [Oleiphilus sp. HI0117]KZZ37651.1 hypothetical protein A3757_10385 [Oleiphilus sp. HI0117]
MSLSSSQLPPEKSFGVLWCAVFLCICAYFYLQANVTLSVLFLSLALVFFVSAFVFPALLRPFNILWFKIGLLLGKVVSPIIIGAIFYVLITPVAIGMRVFGRDELRLKMQKRNSHWKDRTDAEQNSTDFKNQF